MSLLGIYLAIIDLGASLLDFWMPFFLLRIIINATMPTAMLITPNGMQTAMAIMAPELSLESVELVALYITTGSVLFMTNDYLQV